MVAKCVFFGVLCVHERIKCVPTTCFMESVVRVSQAAAHHGPTVNDNRATCLRTGRHTIFCVDAPFSDGVKTGGRRKKQG